MHRSSLLALSDSCTSTSTVEGSFFFFLDGKCFIDPDVNFKKYNTAYSMHFLYICTHMPFDRLVQRYLQK